MNSINLNIDSEQLEKAHQPELLLSIHNPKNRRLIQNFLPENLSVKTSKSIIGEKDFDLCILDESSFHLNKQVLKNLKDQAAPLFLPVLLLSRSQNEARSSSAVMEFADDVVYIPVSTKILQLRIQMLLRQREYSLKLEEKNRELEEKNKQLEVEKKKYRLLTENSTDMISRHSPDGSYLYVSPASEELTGYKPEELIGQTPFENMHPEDRERILGNENPFEGGEIAKFTFRKRTKGDSYKWVETVMKPIKDENGELLEIQASTRDITKRMEYEKQLEEEKKVYRQGDRSLPGLFYVIDEDGNYIRWNKNLNEELCYSDEEIKNMHPLNFYREKDQALIISKIEEVFETGSAEVEAKIKAKNGELIPYYITGQKFTKGDKDFIVGSCINLTEEKEAEFEVEQKQNLLKAVINQTKSVISVKDERRRYRLANDGYLELFDLDRDEIIGKTDVEIHGHEFDQKVRENDFAVLETGELIEVEEEIIVDNEIKYYHTIKYPLKGVPGLENCICSISTDLTDRKEMMHQLEERVKEQTCLYNISSLGVRETTVPELLEEALTYLPDGWRYPEITEASIEFEDQIYKTDGYMTTDPSLTAESNRIKGKPLYIDIVYTQMDKFENEDPFLREERELIDTIADTLSSQVDRILARQKLKQSQKRWESLVQNDPDLIQITTKEGIIKFINPAGAEMYGADDVNVLIGKNYFDLLTIDEPEIAKSRIKKVMEGVSVPPRIYKMSRKDGPVRYMEIQSVPVQLEGGEQGLQTVGQDVTNRIQYEEKLKKSI